MPTPLLLISDAPFGTSGLSRITTDLFTRMREDGDVAAAFDVRYCGHRPWPELSVEGQKAQDPLERGWEFHDPAGWGAKAAGRAYRYFFGHRPGVIWTIWDVMRCFDLSQTTLPSRLWGYFPVDGETAYGTLPGGSMAREILRRYARVLAYTQYGADLLGVACDPVAPTPCHHLPHGLDLSIWHPLRGGEDDDAARWAHHLFNRDGANLPVIGCVATNNARKDLALVFRTWHLLKARGVHVRLWLHIDRLIGDWNVHVLAEDAGMGEGDLILTNTLHERQLAAAYALCLATIAPGLGEGFGYPIVESLACGTAVYHVNYAGGAEFTPRVAQISPDGWMATAPYGTRRPLVSPGDVAAAITALLEWKQTAETAEQIAQDQQDCVRVVRELGLDWTDLWPRWRQWILEGA